MGGTAVPATGMNGVRRTISCSPLQERQRTNTPPNLTQEILVEGKRAPPIPDSRRQFELETIRKIVGALGPKLCDDERQELEIAAGRAERVQGISPKSEFLANLANGLFMRVLETYAEIERQAA